MAKTRSVVRLGSALCSICCGKRLVTRDCGAEFDEDFAAALSGSRTRRGTVFVRLGRYVSVLTVVCIPFPSPFSIRRNTSDLVIMCIRGSRRVLATARELGARFCQACACSSGIKVPMIRAALEADLDCL